MKTVMGNLWFWIPGVALAAVGVLLARVAGPRIIGSSRVAVVLCGEFVALFGLFLICVGVSRRLRRVRQENREP